MGDAKDPKPIRATSEPNAASIIPRMWEDEPEPSRTAPTGMARSTRGGSAKRPALLVMTGTSAGRILLIESLKVTIGRSRQADFTLRDDGVSRMHCGIACEGTTCVLSDLGSTHGTLVNGGRADRVELRPGDRIQLGPEAILEFDIYDEADEGVAKKLYEGATRDLLTRTLNRRAFHERLTAEVAYAVRHGTKLSVVALAVDHVDAVVDLHGHTSGDAVLRGVAAVLASTIRSEDVLARLRGDGFVVLVRGLSLRSGAKLAERMRRLVEDHVVVFDGKSLRVTISAGVADLREVPEISELRELAKVGDVERAGRPAARETLLELAEHRLATAKSDGANRVIAKS